MNKLNKFSRAILAIAIILCVALPTLAHDFEVGGIYYNYLDKTAKTVAVTYKGSSTTDYYDEYSGSVIIPSSVTYDDATYSVSSIGESAFYRCYGLTSVTIPNSVTEIGYEAFYGCSGLTSVTIPNSVTEIGSSAFYNCIGLTSVTIGNSVTSIGDKAFYSCDGLTSIVVEEGNPKYDSRDNCNAIIETSTNTLRLGCKNSTIPNSVTSIGYEAFYDCDGLTSITIPNSVTSIGNSAFYDCDGLTEVNISDLTAWCKIYFYDYYANPLYYAKEFKLNGIEIKDLVIPNDITKIKDYAFYSCDGLTSVTIPNSVTSIGCSAFRYCRGLTSVTIGNSVTSIGEYAFRDCSGLTEVNISDLSAWCKIDFSDYYANPLLYANKLKLNGTEIKDLVIPNDITEIKNYAFCEFDSLTSITIPNSVTSIGDEAFNCDNLRIVKSLSNTPQQCNDNAFGENPAALLMVPKGSMMSYTIADGWRHFTKIQEFEVEDVVKPVLTIAYPEGGVIKQKVDNGTILELQIVPSNGWKCNSVTFNGVDVTNNLDADGNYNTPSITADSQLSIVFVKNDSGVESTLANDIKVCVNGNTVTILGADEFDDVEIYNTSGINVYNGIEKSITLDSNGIYILTVEGETFKFAM